MRRKSIKFIRELTGKAARLKEIKMDSATLNAEKALPVIELPKVKKDAPKTEEVVAETTEAPATQEAK